MSETSLLASPATGLSDGDLQALSYRVRKGDRSAIAALGQQFESLFMAQIVKEMRQTLEPGTLFGNDSADVYGGLFDLFLGKHLAATGNGGLGISALLQRGLHLETPTVNDNQCSSSPWQTTSTPSPKPA